MLYGDPSSTAEGNEFQWLVGHRCESLVRRDFDWIICFNNKATLVVHCLWRLIHFGRIVFTSEDHGHKFGLPAPVDAAAEVSQLLSTASVTVAKVRPGTLDLEFTFSNGYLLQVIPNSAGYEAWQLVGDQQHFIAVGGGDLAMYERPQ